MNRIKRGVTAHSKHKKVLKLAKGYYGARSRVFRVAKQAVIKASQYAFRDRKALKRDMRSLWIVRINGALSTYAITYSVFIHRLKTLKVDLNRKMLAELALHNPDSFNSLVERTLAVSEQAAVGASGKALASCKAGLPETSTHE